MKKNEVVKSNPLLDSMNALINKALNPDISDVTTTFTDEHGDIEVAKQAFELVNAKGKTTVVTVTDPAIIAAIRQFQSADKVAAMTMYIKAKALARMADHIETIQAMNFKTVGKFAHHVLGISELTANQYARVGKLFLDENGLPLSCFPAGIEVTKLQEFLPYTVKDDGTADVTAIEGLYARQIIVDGMTQSALREALKKAFNLLPAGKTDAAETTEKAEKAEKAEKPADAQAMKSTFIDSLDGMEPAQAAAAVLSALDIVKACFDRFAPADRFNMDEVGAMLGKLGDVARAMVDVK